jgi:hypothetical protein
MAERTQTVPKSIRSGTLVPFPTALSAGDTEQARRAAQAVLRSARAAPPSVVSVAAACGMMVWIRQAPLEYGVGAIYYPPGHLRGHLGYPALVVAGKTGLPLTYQLIATALGHWALGHDSEWYYELDEHGAMDRARHEQLSAVLFGQELVASLDGRGKGGADFAPVTAR